MFTFRDLSADLLRMIPDNHILLAKLCAFYPGSAAEINQLHERVSGQSLTEACFVSDVDDINISDDYSDYDYVLFVIQVRSPFIRGV